MPEPASADAARAELAEPTVASPRPMTGYSRSKFPHWIQQGERRDTREIVLARDGENIERDMECRAVSETWLSLYDNKTLTAASQVDIDHVAAGRRVRRAAAAGGGCHGMRGAALAGLANGRSIASGLPAPRRPGHCEVQGTSPGIL
ncbi:hypothetical protein ACFU76_23060 [Streptomyces sp. NPDC057539]|uniref:hypothetical protein n=1 Tax=Streptomyces sp. NPDC057539 TaxID=3346159 RepID=UPI00367F6CD6